MARKPKPLDPDIKKALLTLVDKIDPIKLTSILSVTYVIKNGIDFTQTVTLPTLKGIYGSTALWNLFPWLPILKSIDIKKLESNEAVEWFLSFGAAYLIVENFDKILESGRGLLGAARLFLAAR